MRGFAPERRTPVRVQVELRAPLGKLAHVCHAFFDEHADRRLVAQTIARLKRIAGVKRRAVIVSERSGDAALRVAGVAFGGFGLRQDQHAAGRSQADRRAQAGDSTSDDEKIRTLCRQVTECYPSIRPANDTSTVHARSAASGYSS